jgi:hypothetical protein
MKATTFLILNLALGFYNTGTIWAHEVDIFRSWRFVGAANFHTIQSVHWRKLPYWVFAPVGLALCGVIALGDHGSGGQAPCRVLRLEGCRPKTIAATSQPVAFAAADPSTLLNMTMAVPSS